MQTGILGALEDLDWASFALEDQVKADREATRDAQLATIEEAVLPVLEEAIREEIAESKPEPQLRLVYDANWKRWCDYARAHDFDAVPAHPLAIAAYLMTAYDGSGKESARQAAAISWGHRVQREDDDPCEHILVRSALRALRSQKAAIEPPAQQDGRAVTTGCGPCRTRGKASN